MRAEGEATDGRRIHLWRNGGGEVESAQCTVNSVGKHLLQMAHQSFLKKKIKKKVTAGPRGPVGTLSGSVRANIKIWVIFTRQPTLTAAGLSVSDQRGLLTPLVIRANVLQIHWKVRHQILVVVVDFRRYGCFIVRLFKEHVTHLTKHPVFRFSIC